MEDKILDLLVNQEEVSWKGMIYDLVNRENMNPWDINVSLLTQKYIEKINALKQSDLKVSGKVLLAAAMLLRIKSKRLLGADIDEFDRLIASTEQDSNEFYDSLEQELKQGEKLAQENNYELYPRFPMPRKRKVSVYDLVSALEKALEVKKRRFGRYEIHEMKIPEKQFDITTAIQSLYSRLKQFFNQLGGKITFSQLVNSKQKQDKVYTFIPLLHLSNEAKIELEQPEHFGEIYIKPGEIKDECQKKEQSGSQQNGDESGINKN